MAINQSTFLEGGTTSTTGGTSKTLVSRGGSATKQEFYVNEDTTAATRRYVTATVTPTRLQASAPNGMTQERASLGSKRGKQLSNSAWTNNTIQTVMAVDPETTDAERSAMLNEHIQMLLANPDLFLKLNAS